jgi:hypothetical protein
MHWELWDTESGNLVEDFDTEAEALQGVRELLAVNRADYIDFLVLGAMYDEGESRHEELPPVLAGTELQSRLAELAQDAVAETSRKVHERIRKWLAEENWGVRRVDDPQATFNIMATLPEGPDVNIFQYKDHADRITISQHWELDKQFRFEVANLPVSVQKDIVYGIFRDVSIMGIEFFGFDVPPTDMRFRAYVYFDGLTKDILVQRVLLTIRALHLAIRTFIRAFEENNQSAETAARLLDLIPPAGGSLTLAS